MKRRHDETLRYVEAINLKREIDRKRHAYQGGFDLRESVGESARPLLEQVHAAELEACTDDEIREEVAETHRLELDGFENRPADLRLYARREP